jgi:FkbM family methyltransferase
LKKNEINTDGFKYPKTKNYYQKYITRKIFGKKAYKYFKALKVRLLKKAGRSFEISDFIKKIIKSDFVIFDVGANLGQYAVRLSGYLKGEGKIICVEPVIENYNYLLKLKRMYKFTNMICANYALSDYSGVGELYIPVIDNNIELDTRATIDKKNYYFRYGKYNKQKVNVTTLEKLFSELGLNKIDIIKSDTEGNDRKVILGSFELIKKHLPMILVEDSNEEEWLKELYEIGYAPYYVTDNIYIKDAYKVNSETKNVKLDLLVLIHNSKMDNFKKYIKE